MIYLLYDMKYPVRYDVCWGWNEWYWICLWIVHFTYVSSKTSSESKSQWFIFITDNFNSRCMLQASHPWLETFHVALGWFIDERNLIWEISTVWLLSACLRIVISGKPGCLIHVYINSVNFTPISLPSVCNCCNKITIKNVWLYILQVSLERWHFCIRCWRY